MSFIKVSHSTTTILVHLTEIMKIRVQYRNQILPETKEKQFQSDKIIRTFSYKNIIEFLIVFQQKSYF